MNSSRSLNTIPSKSNPSRIKDGPFFKLMPEKCTQAQTVAISLKSPAKLEIKEDAKSSSKFIDHLKVKRGVGAIEKGKLFMKQQNSGEAEIRTVVQKHDISQDYFEFNVLKFVIDSNVPLQIVENASFEKIFLELNVSINMISYHSLCTKMDKLFIQNLDYIKYTFEKLKYVSTTADIWPGRRSSFLVLTAHWINEDLQRVFAALACKRFRDSPMNRIAELISEIQNEFLGELDPPKVVATTVTDNGANFLKAFKEYGVKSECEEEEELQDLYSRDSNSAGDSLEDVQPTDFSNYEEIQRSLPHHIICCAHTLNLCASTDISKAIDKSENLSSVHKSVMSKCNFLWQAASKSESAENIKEILGYSLKRPRETRWNSLYDALKNVLEMKEKCAQVFQVLNIKTMITEDEFIYIEEHLECAKPVAEALDILQAEKHSFYGTVVAVLFALVPKLENLSNRQWRFCKPIAECFLGSINHRFQDVLCFKTPESKNAAIAALSHPKFKNRWFSRVPLKLQNEIGRLFKEAVAAESNAETYSEQNSYVNSRDFFEFENEASICQLTSAEIQVLNYLKDTNQSLEMLNCHPEVKKVFIKYNTPVPSSTPVQRLFSYATLINLSKSNKLSDKNFETRAILKANFHLLSYSQFQEK